MNVSSVSSNAASWAYAAQQTTASTRSTTPVDVDGDHDGDTGDKGRNIDILA